ncbi:MAG TPA: hypothetical protein VEZ41_07780 [Allosphingosinicella sp.]|nr:hypothetical protein [Allosphingosinicella sp.]
MFVKLSERAVRLGEARAARRRELLAARLRELAPAGVAVVEEDQAVVLRARAGRFAGDSELPWLVAEARDG